ncbi:hypothetical protein [Planctomicrobium piriforme]|uniref:Uncharacterized protein n=1 Tax=Planctomicrobium piriforme TaxID=1576369 RepID=A0A1I3P6J9_9PLAN|nr:hypothetical protein [Planctomicrobium piriforme]SFJ17021.1 hypothetical protein SAMN05421753_11650 [Planctomicrobium piriforme]
MWYIDIDRKELGAALTSGRSTLSSHLEKLDGQLKAPIPRRMVRLLWHSPSDAFLFPPAVMAAPKAELRECLAWCTTYVGPLSPITAYTRVMSPEALFRLQNMPNGGDVESWFITITMAMAEATIATQSTPRNTEEIAAADIFCTYSFAKGRAETLGLPQEDWNIEERWRDLALFFDRPQRNYLLALQSVWRTTSNQCGRHRMHDNKRLFPVVDIGDGDAPQFIALRRLGLRLDEIIPDASLEEITEAMRGTREGRIDYFHRTVHRLAKERTSVISGDLRCGFLASLLSLGSMEYLPLAVALLPMFPEAPFWYAVCVALYAANSMQREAFLSEKRGLARRILRELCASATIADPLTADISLDELLMIGGDRAALTEVHRSTQNGINVELAPFINVDVVVDRYSSTENQPADDDRRNRMFQEWLVALDSHISALDTLLNNRPSQRSESRSKGRQKR